MSNFGRTKLMHSHMSGDNNTKVTRKSPLEPFRITDGVMTIGKYKGNMLSEIPRDYLEWMIRKMDLSDSRISAIKDILK